MKSIVIVFIATIITLYANITIDSGEVYELGMEENLTISGDLKINHSGSLTAREDSNISVEKDWINEGNFTASTSTVRFVGTTPSTIKGANTFYNFISNKDITFESNQTQEITNSFTLKDATINSTTPGVQSIINLATVKKIDTNTLNIKDSKIIGRASAINPPNSTDNGNNILWFSSQNECQNIGSGYDWFDRLKCKDEDTEYLTNNKNSTSKVSFKKDIDVRKTVTDKKVIFTYEATADSGTPCSKKIEVQLKKNSTITTGYKSCNYSDPTLKNWDDFTNAKVFIKELAQSSSKSVIIIDVNLTKKLIIGGSVEN